MARLPSEDLASTYPAPIAVASLPGAKLKTGASEEMVLPSFTRSRASNGVCTGGLNGAGAFQDSHASTEMRAAYRAHGGIEAIVRTRSGVAQMIPQSYLFLSANPGSMMPSQTRLDCVRQVSQSDCQSIM